MSRPSVLNLESITITEKCKVIFVLYFIILNYSIDIWYFFIWKLYNNNDDDDDDENDDDDGDDDDDDDKVFTFYNIFYIRYSRPKLYCISS